MHPHDSDADAALLDILTAAAPPTKSKLPRRDAVLDPLMIAAALASGPHTTRNHYHHDFFPGVMLPQHEGSWDWSKWAPGDKQQHRRLTYVSRQAPRCDRLSESPSLLSEAAKENDCERGTTPACPRRRRPSILTPVDTDAKARAKTLPSLAPAPDSKPGPVTVKCMVRTRIPTPHGSAFLHLYHNNRDAKEHLAIVMDSAQYAADAPSVSAPPIRSASLDAVWPGETEADRITRGAYVGRLSPTSRVVSTPASAPRSPSGSAGVPPPLVRIHSECFTGETVGSMRCDCGEQLDEALRLISQPITVPLPDASGATTTIPGRGAVVYLRQEGRGIGLLSKLRAYNLQDLGHDTVTANLLLGHGADERGYEVAAAILRDLGMGPNDGTGEGVRLLTNNPDKVDALAREGLRVAERVPMVPRAWRAGTGAVAEGWLATDKGYTPGATLVGGHAVHGADLDKYLRTKVLRMGHMLPLLTPGNNYKQE
ncbi:GTP cyclohydrolase II-domain-containing protein [Mycena pura]|uniref:GTP cyclohydrolase II n=1 Tax=Mycena pura TaxID=153505 RepID=A0AAD7E4G5_9AGAR|nr:GTP cyclohydrolase II-domain-containing protein [Mycena pura]